MSAGKVLGVLNLYLPEGHLRIESEVAFVEAAAHTLGGMIIRKRAQEELQQTAERLREVDRLKSEFLANMSHELRTPLNSILGYTELMLMGIEGDLNSETRQDVQAIHDNGQHLLTLINDILDQAKIAAGRMALNLEPVCVTSTLEEVQSSNAGLLVNKPIEMVIESEQDLPLVEADRVRLNQILNNLVSNAVKFTEQGAITLHAFHLNGKLDEAGRGDGWVCIEVQDTGIGINETDLEGIFEKFQQADGSFKRRAEGTGLGLAITRSLVELHGGTIDVRSQLGQGSTFTVRLPALHPEAQAVPDSGDGTGASGSIQADTGTRDDNGHVPNTES